jgi:hypothetical protein
MKTRQEIVYDFLLVLASNPKVVETDSSPKHAVDNAWDLANLLTDKYYESLS